MTSEDHLTRITNLEILYSEQEYTIETLNSIVTQQSQHIELLKSQIELFKHQLHELKKNQPENTIVDEKPPHY
jgi:uncharacterized coiled-coil protein SlyX